MRAAAYRGPRDVRIESVPEPPPPRPGDSPSAAGSSPAPLIVVDMHEERLETAHRLGADVTLKLGAGDVSSVMLDRVIPLAEGTARGKIVVDPRS